ncbi:hypothetical protein FisN_16Hh111 [Fistulifera solaris]|uniref:Helicase-associated domain-containing protein n=1 Tax=Fistulifera solaris TaxID=1519565 RepID=A0A1Z5KTY3_FISSO|nr:hypothetical protein FisN_16Hh111 [Fistulifera solaris]|eukprot:GAX29448.1 hypothetical protein FisN_16Hh111 [Fistulifera solaris]
MSATEHANDRQWMERYERLLAFQNQQGHCNVPNTYPPDPQLAKWVKKQRYNEIAGKLRGDRKQLLETIGFAWSKINNATFDEQWMEAYQQLVAYKKTYGHTKVKAVGVNHQDQNEKQLAAWVYNQRALQRSGELRSDRKALLDQIGFRWRKGTPAKLPPSAAAILDQRWMDRYDDMVAFQKETGHCRVPFTYPENPQLAIWVLNQRKFQKAGQLRKDRYNLLDRIGFVWRTSKNDDEREIEVEEEEQMEEGFYTVGDENEEAEGDEKEEEAVEYAEV